MEITKKEIKEIIDYDDNLIGKNDKPESTPNDDSEAQNTTDANVEKGRQIYSNDLLNLFGFYIFRESKNNDHDSHKNLKKDIMKIMYEKYLETLEYYHKNPDKIDDDYKKHFNSKKPLYKKIDLDWAKKIINKIKGHINNIVKENNIVNESSVTEDSLTKKTDNDIVKKSDNEIKTDKLKKVAGLIKKMNKNDYNKLINLLELKNE